MKKRRKRASSMAAALAICLAITMVLPMLVQAAEPHTETAREDAVWQQSVLEHKDGDGPYLMHASRTVLGLRKKELDEAIEEHKSRTGTGSTAGTQASESTTAPSAKSAAPKTGTSGITTAKDPLDDGTPLCAKRNSITTTENGKTIVTTSWNTGTPVDTPEPYTGTDKCEKCGGKKLCQGCYGSGKIRVTSVESQSGKADKLISDHTDDCGGCDGSCWCVECGGTGKKVASKGIDFSNGNNNSSGSRSSGNSSGDYEEPPYGDIEGNSCPTCGGVGGCDTCFGDKKIFCSKCGGTGDCTSCYGQKGRWSGYGEHRKWIKCSSCHEKGTCSKCKGDRYVKCPTCNGEGTCPTCKR